MSTYNAGQRTMLLLLNRMQPVVTATTPALGETGATIFSFQLFFVIVFAIWAVLWRRVARKKTPSVSASSMSSVHAVVCVLAAYPELAAWMSSTQVDLDSPNSPQQALQLQFSLGYVLADTVYMFIFTPNDYLFLAHHALAGLYLVAAMVHGAGAISAILVFFLGEITGPLFSAFSIAKELRHDVPFAAKIFTWISPAFTVAFVLVRSLVSPVIISWYLRKLWFESTAIPLYWRIFMGSLVLAGMAGSQLWSYKLLRGFMKSWRRDRLKKLPKQD